MSQHDYVIDNQNGVAFRSDLNAALQAIVSDNAGVSPPPVTFAFMPWADTLNGLLKRRDASNSTWVTEGVLNEYYLGAQPYSANIPTVLATKAEMEAGVEAGVRSMSPLRVAQAISSLSSSSQLRSISASVSANAMTISALALSLDFRSPTLGSGAVTRVSGTPANLVISAGSTLGTVGAVSSRIVVLALNNWGTIELAVVNLAGGVNLNETGVISTTAEGGVGAADSATIVYSTTARTNLAYRVLGYIESTQSTAGFWATAPSTIQGQGGQALTNMSSLGYGQFWQSVTGSRALSTTYYNTTGKPIVVSVWKLGAVANAAYCVKINGVISGYSGLTSAGSTFASIISIIPAGASYSVDPVNTTPGITGWSELR